MQVLQLFMEMYHGRTNQNYQQLVLTMVKSQDLIDKLTPSTDPTDVATINKL